MAYSRRYTGIHSRIVQLMIENSMFKISHKKSGILELISRGITICGQSGTRRWPPDVDKGRMLVITMFVFGVQSAFGMLMNWM